MHGSTVFRRRSRCRKLLLRGDIISGGAFYHRETNFMRPIIDEIRADRTAAGASFISFSKRNLYFRDTYN